MNPYIEEQQIEEQQIDWDDEESKFDAADLYDDLAFGLPLDSGNDF
jgi:hypothetical protein